MRSVSLVFVFLFVSCAAGAYTKKNIIIDQDPADSYMQFQIEKIEHALNKLSHSSVWVRLQGLEVLSYKPAFNSVKGLEWKGVQLRVQEALIKVGLTDPFPAARVKGLKALQVWPLPPSDLKNWRRFMFTLHSPQVKVRRQAFQTLESFRSSMNFPPAVQVRIQTAMSSGLLQPSESVSLRVRSMIYPASWMQIRSFRSLEPPVLQSAAFLEEVSDHLIDSSVLVRLQALRLLNQLDVLVYGPVLKKIAGALFDPFSKVRIQALDLLEKFKPKDLSVLNIMAQAVRQTGRSFTQMQTLRVLTDWLQEPAFFNKHIKVINTLIPVLDDPNIGVRLAAARFFAAVSLGRAVPRVVQALTDQEAKDSFFKVREASRRALTAIQAQDQNKAPAASKCGRSFIQKI